MDNTRKYVEYVKKYCKIHQNTLGKSIRINLGAPA